MTEIADLTATEALRRIAEGRLTPAGLLEACLDRIAQREPVVQAMAYLDAAVVRAATPRPGPLHGMPLGVKDVLDTADMPTGYNSPIWSGWRPRADAAPVAWARAAGAVVLGKTVTTEFATRHPGPTTNPHDPNRTPGGSSSGSAAGVAAGYFPWAYGTQTAGSVVRPAAYCGVVGYKPSYGLINRHGMKLMSESLDTIGIMARSVADCTLLAGVLAGTDFGDPTQKAAAPRIGLCWTSMRERALPETVALMEQVAGQLARAGAHVTERDLPAGYDAVEAAHAMVMNAESARAMGWELTHHADQLSAGLREKLEWGLAQGGGALDEARATFRRLQAGFPAVMDDVDILLTPSAPGEAPLGLEWTGDASFNLIWTSLHVPCVTVPAGTGPNGMPLGIQVVGRLGDDRAVLAYAQWVANALA
jgi:Asp-tRNA(Asn)/Glu-tRNA(Gln) amidotransferase A subunit family amidase